MSQLRVGRPLEQYELGAKAGKAWLKRQRGLSAIAAARAAGEAHWRAVERNKSTAQDAPDYGTGFLDAALGTDVNQLYWHERTPT